MLVEKHQTLKNGLQTAHKKGVPQHTKQWLVLTWLCDLLIYFSAWQCLRERDGKDQ